MRKLKSRYEDLVKEKSFVEEQLTAEKIKYENDILHLNAKLTHLQDETVATSHHPQQQIDNTSSPVAGGDEEVKVFLIYRHTLQTAN